MKTTDKDILKDNARLKEMPFGTSEGYFQNLKKNLKSIPKEQSDKRISPTWSRISATAAIAIIAAAGAILLSNPSSDKEFTEEDYLVFSDDLSTDVIYSASTLYAYSEDITEDDIIEYLIDSDMEIDDIQ